MEFSINMKLQIGDALLTVQFAQLVYSQCLKSELVSFSDVWVEFGPLTVIS